MAILQHLGEEDCLALHGRGGPCLELHLGISSGRLQHTRGIWRDRAARLGSGNGPAAPLVARFNLAVPAALSGLDAPAPSASEVAEGAEEVKAVVEAAFGGAFRALALSNARASASSLFTYFSTNATIQLQPVDDYYF